MNLVSSENVVEMQGVVTQSFVNSTWKAATILSGSSGPTLRSVAFALVSLFPDQMIP